MSLKLSEKQFELVSILIESAILSAFDLMKDLDDDQVRFEIDKQTGRKKELMERMREDV